MIARLRAMPLGIRLFLVYGLLILAAIGVALPAVVDLAIGAPITFTGIVVMTLLAYTIFTLTLILQRKQAGRGFALGLASLTVPVVPVLLAGGYVPQAAVVAGVAGVLLYGLLRPDVRGYLTEP
jgi:succinate-acetate transporter protein